MSFKVSPKAKAIINRNIIFQFHNDIHLKTLPVEYDCQHIFEIPGVSNEKPNISFEITNISIENLGLLLIWMCTFQTDNRIFKIRIISVDQCSRDCCSGVFISTLSKYMLDKLYYYTNYDFFLRLRLVAISLFVTYCVHVHNRCRLTQPNIEEQWDLLRIVILHQK